MTFVILACALPSFQSKWWPFFVVLFYVLSPIPTLIARRHTDGTGGTSSPCMDVAIFITMGIIVSSFGLPIVLARAGTIASAACYLTVAGNIIVYLTILGFFTIFDMDDNDYAMCVERVMSREREARATACQSLAVAVAAAPSKRQDV